MLEVENLTVAVDGREVLRGLDLEVGEGETHVIFGPNGSGKTSLALTLLGFPQYRVVSGSIRLNGVELKEKSIDERARLGLGMAFQRPVAVRGVRLGDILRHLGAGAELLGLVNLPPEFLDRELNVGFSGGEARRAEVLQVLAQRPKFVIFDEPDSGLDVENLELVGKAINDFLKGRSGILITHLGHILRHVQAHMAHVLLGGRIACSGPPSKILAQILKEGYRWCETCPRSRR